MKLRELLPADASYDPRLAALEIEGMSADSRHILPDYLFAAVPGTKADGLTFLPQALSAGAVAVMAEGLAQVPDDVAAIRVPNIRRALALAAANFYPEQPKTIAAVTGTSGKTSVAAFTRQIWATLGHRAASIGTVGVVSPSGDIYGSLTTPDPVELHKTIHQLALDGVTHLALEASSHGLLQHRLDGVHITVGGFTNLSRDHLDYHGTLEAYLEAKLILFKQLIPPGGCAVIASGHSHTEQVVAAAKQAGMRVFTVGRGGNGLNLLDIVVEGFSQTLHIEHSGKKYRVRLPLVGEFQVENALVAAGFAITTGGDPAAVFSALEGLEGAKGRLELVGQKDGAPIFVDYAHKPDALSKALDALRPYVKRRLVVVFGAGGDRDQGKRPLMGAIAAEKADRVIVTDDNPRSEDPAAIRSSILAATRGALEIGDRAQAIRQAVAELHTGDVLLVAGKGHETGQIVGGKVLPFSDHEAVAAALRGSVR
jgi:UDP-N-acetylmuramoyl-L-alanyl-D-glutamate--2,6-diaminopimelate ligase